MANVNQGPTVAVTITDHDEYECPGCLGLAEYRIVVDVYGCRAGRHCTEATLEQRIEFEKQIAERIAARRRSGHRDRRAVPGAGQTTR